MWKNRHTGNMGKLGETRGWQKDGRTFFPFFSHPTIPRKPRRGVPVAPVMLLELLRRDQVRVLAGMVYSSLFLEMIYTCCREVEWDWVIGDGVGKAKSQTYPPFP